MVVVTYNNGTFSTARYAREAILFEKLRVGLRVLLFFVNSGQHFLMLFVLISPSLVSSPVDSLVELVVNKAIASLKVVDSSVTDLTWIAVGLIHHLYQMTR